MAVDSYMTLSQLQERIRETLCRGFAAPVWITAEIGELKVNARSGHCYLQLVEKGGRNGVPQAQVQAVIWAGQYGMLSSYFRGATGEELAVGMKVLLHVTVTYHELYGLSLRIVDIDPLYTLGDLARQRMQTIAQLREDGVFDLNRELGIPEVPQRIAVVSSPQAAGYQDFMKELGASPYRFDVTLFGAVMQGHGAETSIIGALDAVADRAEEFDAAVIIRGGGSQSDLSFLNSYLLSFRSPVPPDWDTTSPRASWTWSPPLRRRRLRRWRPFWPTVRQGSMPVWRDSVTRYAVVPVESLTGRGRMCRCAAPCCASGYRGPVCGWSGVCGPLPTALLPVHAECCR